MSEEQPKFVVTTGRELRQQGYSLENYTPLKLSPGAVPPALHPLIPMAEAYGISDDVIRNELVDSLSPEAKQALVEAVLTPDVEDALDDWLAGDAEMTPEYIAFTSLRMAAEEAEAG